MTDATGPLRSGRWHGCSAASSLDFAEAIAYVVGCECPVLGGALLPQLLLHAFTEPYADLDGPTHSGSSKRSEVGVCRELRAGPWLARKGSQNEAAKLNSALFLDALAAGRLSAFNRYLFEAVATDLERNALGWVAVASEEEDGGRGALMQRTRRSIGSGPSIFAASVARRLPTRCYGASRPVVGSHGPKRSSIAPATALIFLIDPLSQRPMAPWIRWREPFAASGARVRVGAPEAGRSVRQRRGDGTTRGVEIGFAEEIRAKFPRLPDSHRNVSRPASSIGISRSFHTGYAIDGGNVPAGPIPLTRRRLFHFSLGANEFV